MSRLPLVAASEYKLGREAALNYPAAILDLVEGNRAVSILLGNPESFSFPRPARCFICDAVMLPGARVFCVKALGMVAHMKPCLFIYLERITYDEARDLIANLNNPDAQFTTNPVFVEWSIDSRRTHTDDDRYLDF